MQRFAMIVIISFIATLLAGYLLIPVLRRLKFGQNVRHDGPRTHLKKAGTPTMGGFIFLIPTAIVTLAFSQGSLEYVSVVLLVSAGFAVLGFLDDYIKVVKKRSLGLRAYQKIIGQVGIAVILSYYAYTNKHIGSSVIIPFFGTEWDLGVFYIPVAAFIIVGTVNSVNLTDGLDGLATGVSLIVSVTLSIIIFAALSSSPLKELTYVSENYRGLLAFVAALTGACLGFLRFNTYPAKVIMGDTGSLALGGAFATLSILLKLPLLLPIIGGVFMAEAVSVILQVGSFKLRGKRVFRMAPLHHHFELAGMPETKVGAMFIIATVVLCLVGLISI